MTFGLSAFLLLRSLSIVYQLLKLQFIYFWALLPILITLNCIWNKTPASSKAHFKINLASSSKFHWLSRIRSFQSIIEAEQTINTRHRAILLYQYQENCYNYIHVGRNHFFVDFLHVTVPSFDSRIFRGIIHIKWQ